MCITVQVLMSDVSAEFQDLRPQSYRNFRADLRYNALQLAKLYISLNTFPLNVLCNKIIIKDCYFDTQFLGQNAKYLPSLRILLIRYNKALAENSSLFLYQPVNTFSTINVSYILKSIHSYPRITCVMVGVYQYYY